MIVTVATSLFALMPPAGGNGQGSPPMWTTFVVPVLLLVIMYFMLIRPQQQRTKQHAELMKSLKRGDKILTSGGIIASVVTVGDGSITIRSADTKLEIQKSAISEILERSGANEP